MYMYVSLIYLLLKLLWVGPCDKRLERIKDPH